MNLKGDVSLKKIVFFSTGPGVSLCAQRGWSDFPSSYFLLVSVLFCGRPLALFTSHYPSSARTMYVFSVTPRVSLDTGDSGD